MSQMFSSPVEFAKFFRETYLWNISGGCSWRLKVVDFFCKKFSMIIAGLGSKYASAYDTSFYWKDFPNRFHLIKTNTTLNSDPNKIFAWIYLRREIKTQILRRLVFVYYSKTGNYNLGLQLSVIWLKMV